MNNYEILGLQKGADISEVKSKFRQLSKKWHPDMPGGNAAKFISIRKAYEALLEGDTGEKPQYSQQDFMRDMDEKFRKAHQDAQWQAQRAQSAAHQAYYRQQQQERMGEFRFLGIDIQDEHYHIKFFVNNVSQISVFGKGGQRIGFFNTSYDYGNIALRISFASAEWGEYVFECVLQDKAGGSATKVYKVKKPMNNWEKMIDKLKFWKK